MKPQTYRRFVTECETAVSKAPLRALEVRQRQWTQRESVVVEVFHDARQVERRLQIASRDTQQLAGAMVLLRQTRHRIRSITHGPHLRPPTAIYYTSRLDKKHREIR